MPVCAVGFFAIGLLYRSIRALHWLIASPICCVGQAVQKRACLIDESCVIGAVRIDDQGAGQRTQVDQMMPVAPIARQASGLDAINRTDIAGRPSRRAAQTRGAAYCQTLSVQDRHRLTNIHHGGTAKMVRRDLDAQCCLLPSSSRRCRETRAEDRPRFRRDPLGSAPTLARNSGAPSENKLRSTLTWALRHCHFPPFREDGILHTRSEVSASRANTAANSSRPSIRISGVPIDIPQQ
jgi:hypothetical protein